MNMPFSYKYSVYALAIIVTSLFLPLIASAQSLSSINGVVTDASGAVIPDVTVTVTNKGTSRTTVVTTNASGFYVVPNLPSGIYDVRAEKAGFQASAQRGIKLDPASTISINATLQVGSVSQTVEVNAAAVHVQSSNSAVSRLVNSTQMEQLPLNGRNFVSLLMLQPGVVTSFSFNSFQAENTFTSQCTHVNGLTGESNNFLVDGTPSTRTRANGAMVALPSAEAIGEVNVVTNGYMPEYSRAAGGQMIVAIKSGTNEYHGDVYEFNRNDSFNARYFFSPTVPKLDYNDYGFTFGGPVPGKIFKHKLFFFDSEEWMRIVSGNTEAGTVPTAADRSGNLSGYCAVFTRQCPTVPAYLNGVDGLVAGQPFPNDTIPSNLFSPNGSAMVQNLYLQPNTVTHAGTAYPMEGGLNEIFNWNGWAYSRADDIKIDYNANDKNSMYVSMRQFDKSQQNPYYGGSGGGSGVLGIGYVFPSRSASYDLTTTFSPTLLNDFTASGGRDFNNPVPLPGLNGRNGLDRTSLGITFPYILGPGSKDVPGKIPTFIMSGFDTVSGLPYPSFSTGHIWTLQDILTKISGNHTVKVGVWWEHDGENDADQVRVTPGGGVGNNLNGQFEFNAAGTNTTGSPLADALLGNFDSYSELGYRDYTLWGAHQIGVFGQDSWKVTRSLTVQGGMRWDYFQPYSANWCNWAMFNPLFYSHAPGVAQVVGPNGQIVGGNPYNGIATPCQQLPQSAVGHFSVLGQPLTAQNLNSVNTQLRNDGMQRGLSSQIVQSHFGNFQPRFGFAWDPSGHGTTVVRGGGGIFYNHNTLSDVTLMGGNTPFQLATEVFNGSADNPGGTPGAQLPIPMTGQDLIDNIPVVYSWNFGVQHQFFSNTLVDVSYVGNRGRFMPINADLNQPVIGTFNNPLNAGIPQDALRPYPGIGGAMTTLQEGNSQYDSLQVSVQRRFTNGFQYNVSYTYSKAFDMADSIYSVLTDTYDPRYNWGLAGFNQTHNMIATWIYDLPFLKSNTTFVGKTLGGWELSGDLALQSGFPFSVGANGDPLGNGTNTIGGAEYADVAPSCNTRGNRSFTQFFNTSCFSQPTAATLAGTAARGIIEGPGLDNLDFALMKNGRIAEKWGHDFTYQLRGEFFNALNHPSFTGLSTTVTNSNFGAVTGATTQREVQLGLKILF
jgi:hypothetical protein